jgi:protein involved in temperature-dependent protein secretion
LVLALAPQWQRQAPPATADLAAAIDAAPAAGASALDQAIAANQALEAALRGAARPGVLDGRAAIANAELEDLIGMLDLELSDTRDDARASALWRERAQLLEELAGLRTGVGGTYADNRGSASLVPAAYTIN